LRERGNRRERDFPAVWSDGAGWLAPAWLAVGEDVAVAAGDTEGWGVEARRADPGPGLGGPWAKGREVDADGSEDAVELEELAEVEGWAKGDHGWLLWVGSLRLCRHLRFLFTGSMVPSGAGGHIDRARYPGRYFAR